MKLKPIKPAGFALVILFGAVMIFQLLLALGLRLKGAVWGGQFDMDPGLLRIMSLFSFLLLAFLILIILEKMGKLRFLKNHKIINGILWFFACYLMLITLANLLSPGKIERAVMTPLSLITSILCIIVAKEPFDNRS